MDLLNFLNDKIQEEDTLHYSITDVLKMRAEKEADKTAYIFLRDGEDDEEIITYRELYEAATSIARSISLKSKEGERALMLYPPGLEFVKALFGCFFAGIIAVPAYPPRKNRSLNRIKSIVIDSQSSLILTTNQIYEASLKNFTDVDELKNMDWCITEELLMHNDEPASLKPVSNESIALLQYTSGSTGQPKGVMVSHKNIMRNSEYIRQSFELSRNSVSVSWLPSFHDMGLIDGVLQPVFTGFKGVLLPPVSFLQKPSRWLRAITKYRGTHCGGPNFAFDLCVEKAEEEELDEIDLSSMRTLYNGAEPLRKSTLLSFTEKFSKAGFSRQGFYPCYGMAETTLIISGGYVNEKPKYLSLLKDALENNKVLLADIDSPESNDHVGVGHPWIDTKIRIVNPDTLLECAGDEVGEVWVAGSIVTKGYWSKPQETEDAFHAYIKETGEGPFLRTGDLGFFHDGELYISGRLKDLIIIRGRNIYPQDLELTAENCHPALRFNCSAAFSVSEDSQEKLYIAAELERTYMRNPNLNEIADSIRQAIFDEFELDLEGIILLRTASIPKTSSGKIQRKATRKAYLEGNLNIVGESCLKSDSSGNDKESEISLTSIQSWLIAWLSINLKIGIEKINPQRPIVAYGLNSIKAVVLRNDFLKNYGVDFPPYLFFEKMSIEETAGKRWS
ncbi:MAG: AMP-binding protein [Bacteroidota bacterium]|nr:AMP-binding protein [Bacteroidota bacterium]